MTHMQQVRTFVSATVIPPKTEAKPMPQYASPEAAIAAMMESARATARDKRIKSQGLSCVGGKPAPYRKPPNTTTTAQKVYKLIEEHPHKSALFYARHISRATSIVNDAIRELNRQGVVVIATGPQPCTYHIAGEGE